MKIIDRLLLRSFIKAWLICFSSLVSLYLVIDSFQRLDEFLGASDGTGVYGFVRVVGEYYGVQLVLIFDRLAGTLTLLAALFTLAWMQKSNELIPFLATGVPVRRLLRSILLGTCLFTGLAIANRELLLPHIGAEIQRTTRDSEGNGLIFVGGLYDSNGVLIEGHSAVPSELRVNRFACTLPPQLAGGLVNIKAKEAYYVPPGTGPHSGGWLLIHTQPTELPEQVGPTLTMIDPGKFFLKTERATFDLLTRSRGWHEFASTATLMEELRLGEANNLSALAMQLHIRQTGPLATILMVFLGIAVLLRDIQRSIFINAGLCLVLAVLLYGATYAAKYLGERDFVEPVLAAWLPLFIFGPLTLSQWDAARS